MALQGGKFHLLALQSFAGNFHFLAELFEAGLQIGHAVARGGIGRGQVGHFGGEVADFVLKLEHGGAAFRAGAATQHAFTVENDACQGDECHVRLGFAQPQGGGKIGDDEYFFQQPLDDRRDALVRLDAVECPGRGAFGQGDHLAAGGMTDEALGQDCGDAELLDGQALDDQFRHRLIRHQHGLQMAAKRRFDRAGAAVIGLDE